MDKDHQNRNSVKLGNTDYPIRVGEDTAKISLYLNWLNRETALGPLGKARAAAEAGEEEKAIVEFGDAEWMVLPYGVGGRDGKPYMAYQLYRLDAPDIRLSLRDGDFHEQCISGILDIGSITLMCKGSLHAVWLELKAILEQAGAKVVRNVVSRVDMAIDVSGYPVSAFKKKVARKHIVGGCRNDEIHKESEYGDRRETTGIVFGKKKRILRLRIYDKLTESGRGAEGAEGAEKLEVLTSCLGKLEILTRLEFEMRREQTQYWNKNGGPYDDEFYGVEDWCVLRTQVIEYLMSAWVRFTRKNPDRENHHQDQAEEWHVWVSLREAACALLMKKDEKEIERPLPPESDGTHLLNQALGCLVNYLARHFPPVASYLAARESAAIYADYVKANRERCEEKYLQSAKREARRRRLLEKRKKKSGPAQESEVCNANTTEGDDNAA